MSGHLFRKLPVTITAIRTDDICVIETSEGSIIANPGDWIITGVDGEKYPCKDGIFRKIYEPVDENGCIVAWPDE